MCMRKLQSSALKRSNYLSVRYHGKSFKHDKIIKFFKQKQNRERGTDSKDRREVREK